jgi:Tfp pilus assembly protein PilZ
MVNVIDSKSVYTAHLRDLALGGAMIEPPLEIKAQIGEELTMTIPYGLKQDGLTIKARIAWIRRHGMGVRFVTKNSDSAGP